ncbi:hypothetical protein ACS0TY_004173 [Phlomoides rotata]
MRELGGVYLQVGYLLEQRPMQTLRVSVKRELDWTTKESTLASYNSKAFNAIFTSVDTSMLKIISNYVSSKDA